MPDEKFAARLQEIVGRDGISTTPVDLMVYAQDMWPRATISRAVGTIGSTPPDIVVWPSTVEQVIDIVRACRRAHVPFTPVAAGSGVIGGAVPRNGGVVIDVKRLNRLLAVDSVSMIAVVEAGINGMHLEQMLAEKGFTLGHFPSSIMCSTAGGWAACRSAGQYSSRFGKIEDMIVSMDVVLPDGRIVTLEPNQDHPGMPDFSQLVIGSEGTLGIIVRLRLRLAAAPGIRRFSGFRFSKMEAGLDTMRRIMQAGVEPTMMRMYDPLDTLLNSFKAKKGQGGGAGSKPESMPPLVSAALKRMGIPDFKDFGHAVTGPMLGKILQRPALVFGLMDHLPLPSMLVLGFEGSEYETRRALVRANEIALAAKGTALGPEPGEHWYKKRYAVSWKLPKIFAQGAFAETIEVAGLWKDVARIYHAVHSTLQSRVAIMAHFSHAYNEGCAVYFSLAGAAAPGQPSLDLYDWAIENAISQAMAAGGTVSHHHGIGLMKARFLDREWQGGRRVFTAIRDVMDRERLSNPGKLFEAVDAPADAGEAGDSVVSVTIDKPEMVPDSPEEVRGLLVEAARTGRRLSRQGQGSGQGADVRVSMARIDQIIGLDPISRTVHVQAGLPMTLLESYLQEKGLTLGFVPRHLMACNVGEYLATVSPSAGSPLYGTVRQNCCGLEGFLADGTPFGVGATPRRAAGPDLKYCLIGAGGVYGVIVSAVLRVFPVPAVRDAVAFGTADPVAAVSSVRTLIQRGIKPEWALVVSRAPADLGSRRAARLTLQVGGEREDVSHSMDIIRDVMGPLGLTPEPCQPDNRLQPPAEIHEYRDLFLETGPLMSLLGEMTRAEVRHGPESPEIHVTNFSTFGATIHVVLREPTHKVPEAFAREFERRQNFALKQLGRDLSAVLDPSGVLAMEERRHG